MSRDPLNNPHLINRLAQAQAELAARVTPGSHPHPRRVLKEAAKREPWEPEQPKKRRKRKADAE